MIEEKTWCVYMHTNKSNDKKYIGISSNVKRRWSNNGFEYKTQLFGNAINKYGWDGFEHIVLYQNLTKEEACQKEIELIKKYNTTNHLYGYNISSGGEGTNKPFNAIYQYSLDGNYLKKYNNILEIIEEYNMKSSSNVYLCCNGERDSTYGFRWSYNYLGKKIEPLKSAIERTIDGESIAIYQYSLDGEYIAKYKNRENVLKEMNIDPQFCTRGITETAGGYQWFTEYKGLHIKGVLSPSEKLGERQSKKVYMYNKKYELIQIFDKCKDVCTYFKDYHKSIKRAIDNKILYKDRYYLSYEKI